MYLELFFYFYPYLPVSIPCLTCHVSYVYQYIGWLKLSHLLRHILAILAALRSSRTWKITLLPQFKNPLGIQFP